MTGRLADDGRYLLRAVRAVFADCAGNNHPQREQRRECYATEYCFHLRTSEQVVCNLIESIVKQLCFPNVAYMLNNCYIPPTFAKSAESGGRGASRLFPNSNIPPSPCISAESKATGAAPCEPPPRLLVRLAPPRRKRMPPARFAASSSADTPPCRVRSRPALPLPLPRTRAAPSSGPEP